MKNQAAFVACQAGVVPLVRGIPGIAKTATINAFGKATGRRVYTLIGSIREPADIAGYPMLQNGDRPASMAFVPPSWVNELNEAPSILFIDELTCCPPTVQAALLRVMAERVVGDATLRDDVWIIAACNPPEQAAGGYDLEPPMANRLCHLTWEFDWDLWDAGLMNGLSFPAPRVPVVPSSFVAQRDRYASMVAAFRTRKPTIFADFPQNRSQASGPWPSPRSWTNGINCMGAAEAAGCDQEVIHELLSGCIGTGPATEFFTWLRELDLPDPEALLKDALKRGEDVTWKKLARPDQVIACLSSVVSAALQDKSTDRWTAAAHICHAAASQATDIAIACAVRLVKPEHMPKDAKLPPKFVKEFAPILSAAFGGKA